MTIPCGEAGTDATVRVMRSMIEEGKRDQAVRQLAEMILVRYDVPRYQYVTELAALHDWVRRNVRYTKDPHEVEYIQTPRRLLQSRMGDCDDMAVLLGSLAEVVGHPVGIKVVSRDANRNYHHVYPVAEIDGHEYGLDASVPFPFGYQSPDIKKQRVYPSNGVSGMRDVYHGLGKVPPGGGGDGAAAGDTIPITFGPDPRSKVKVSVLGPGARICGPDVLYRVKTGTIRPNLPTTKLRFLSAAESGAGVPCVVAEDVGVYERPIDPLVVGPPGMLDVSAPITLREGQRLCRPDIRMLLKRGMVKAASGTVLRFVTDTATGTPCAAAVVPTDVKIPTEPDIFMPPPDVTIPREERPDVYMPPPDVRIPREERPDVYMPPPDVREPGRHVLEVGQRLCHPDVVSLVSRGLVRAGTGAKLVHEVQSPGDDRSGLIPWEPCVKAVPSDLPAAAERPDVYMPPSAAGTGVPAAVKEEGPLGLPWIVWIGAAGLLVTVLMKK